MGFLEDEFKQRETASQAFPPEISSSHIRSSISRYEDEISAASERAICCSCGSFVPKENVYEIGDQDDFILQEQSRLDQCGNNRTVNHLNSRLVATVGDGTLQESVYQASNRLEAGTDGLIPDLPAETLAFINVSGIPSSSLTLRKGAPVMLLRNLYPKYGLCNGTRLIVTYLLRYCILARISGRYF